MAAGGLWWPLDILCVRGGRHSAWCDRGEVLLGVNEFREMTGVNGQSLVFSVTGWRVV